MKKRKVMWKTKANVKKQNCVCNVSFSYFYKFPHELKIVSFKVISKFTMELSFPADQNTFGRLAGSERFWDLPGSPSSSSVQPHWKACQLHPLKKNEWMKVIKTLICSFHIGWFSCRCEALDLIFVSSWGVWDAEDVCFVLILASFLKIPNLFK